MPPTRQLLALSALLLLACAPSYYYKAYEIRTDPPGAHVYIKRGRGLDWEALGTPPAVAVIERPEKGCLDYPILFQARKPGYDSGRPERDGRPCLMIDDQKQAIRSRQHFMLVLQPSNPAPR